MSHSMLAHRFPFVTLLQPMAESRRQPFFKLQRPRLARHGCIVASLSVNTREAVTCKPADLAERRQHKGGHKGMPERIEAIRAALKSMGDGEISVSAYDTAWVALVRNQEGGDGPQFPLSIDWIVQNQLMDGSWGDNSFFLVQDRLINTIACIIALKSWNIHDDKCRKGLSFIQKNMSRLMDVDEDWMPIGFEITFPMLLEMAKESGLNLPYNDPALQMIYAKRDLKLAKISRDVLHAIPTTLLFNVEGMPCLDWKRLFEFQCLDGSFAASPASTAYALMQTGDKKCLAFIDGIINKFNGGAPYVYPVDIFERLWVVDRLERLGISKYFTSETKQCLDYIYRLWTEEGIPSLKDFPVKDVDATAMGFRLLRLHGYHVSPCVFSHFEKDGEFFCYPRQSNQSVTAMYNLYRAGQVAFPDEDELKRANVYCRAFLDKRRACGRLKDKWLIAKDMPGEVEYALEFPWKASLPRIETRMYLDQYGGSNDVWIGKSLYRMPLVNNDLYLEAAKADFNNFQIRSQLEWHGIWKWYDRNDLRAFGVTSKGALRAYFLAAANIFEQNRAVERLAWARTVVIADAISRHMQCNAHTEYMREGLVSKLDNHGCNETNSGQEDPTEKALLYALHDLIDLSSSGNDSCSLNKAWKQWLMARSANETQETCQGSTALLLVRTVEICSGRHRLMMEQNVNSVQYSQLESLTFSICSKLASGVLGQTNDQNDENMESVGKNIDVEEVEREMQELAHCVLQSCSSISWDTRRTFLHVAKSYYYVAHCSPETVDNHISKVIFKDVVPE